MAAGLGLLLAPAAFAEEAEKVTYEDHVLPVLESRCFSCHNPDRQRGGLDLTTYANTLEGGSGGVVAEAGNPGGSRIYTTAAHEEEPVMPPEGGKIPDAELDILRKWIEGGMLETESSVARRPSRPQVDLSVSAPTGRPDGPPPMPAHALLEPVVVTERGDAVTAMAASPWAPLVAIGGQHQVLLYDAASQELAAVLPYEEGFVESLMFSQAGTLLVAGAGRPGRMGHAVAWDIRDGRRLMEVGREFDSAMSADITPNHSLIAIGSTSRRLRVFRTGDGEMEYELDDHTEWVMSVAFSPDGILLASGDRNGNVFVYEAANGGEFHKIGNVHEGGVTDLAWRGDSNVLASAGADGRVRLWAMANGREIRNIDAHGGGVLSVDFSHDGHVVSSGRDNLVKIWNAEGQALKQLEGFTDLVTTARFLEDDEHVVVGDFLGQVQMWSIAGEEPVKVAELSSHPQSIPVRRGQHVAAAAEWSQQKEQRQGALASARQELEARRGRLQQARAEVERLTAVMAESRALEADTRKKSEEAGVEHGQLVARRGELQQMHEAYRAAREALSEMETRLTSAGEELEQARAALAAAAESQEAGNGDAGDADTEPGDQGADKAELEQAVAEAEARLAEATAQRDEAAKAVPDQPDPIEPVAERIAELAAQMEGYGPMIEKAAADAKAAEEGIQEHEGQMEELEAAVTAQEPAVADADAALAEATEREAFHQRQVQWLQAAEFNVGLISNRNQLRTLEEELEAIQGGREELEAKVETATAAIRQREQDMETWTAAIPVKGETVERLAAESKALGERVEAMQADLKAKEEALTNATAERDRHQAEVERLQAEIARVEAALKPEPEAAEPAESGESAAEESASSDEDAAEAEPAQEAEGDSEPEPSAGEAGREALEQELGQLRAALEAARAAMAESEAMRVEAAAKRDEVRAALEQQQQRLTTMTAEHEAARNEVEELRAKLAETRENLPKMRADLETDKESLAATLEELTAVEQQVGELRAQVESGEQEYLAMLPADATTPEADDQPEAGQAEGES